jgi:hypothetical protein
MSGQSGPGAVAASLLEKVREQVERADHLVALVPANHLEWRPEVEPPAFTTGRLLGHLLECLAGFCAVLYACHPERLGHFLTLRDQPVNHTCGVDEARRRLAAYLRHIEEGFALMSDEDLARVLPTVFVPAGETVMTLMLGNLEHFTNHKFQLYWYLKSMGVAVTTADLYRLR